MAGAVALDGSCTVTAAESGTQPVADPRWAVIALDCFKALPGIENKSIDHVICDPAYETQAHTKARRALVDSTQKRGARNTGKVRRIDQPLHISFDAITESERTAVGLEAARIAKRWVIAFCQIEAVAAWKASFEAAGLEWVRGGVWRKPDGSPQFTGDRPGQGFESLAIAHQPGKKRWNGGGKHAVWTFPLEHGHGNGERNEHPTQKPLALMLALVEDFTDPGDTILDPFCGSGTTGVAALRLGRRFIGIEKDATYRALAVERLKAEGKGSTLQAARAGQVALFGSEQ
jgi:DNA modification methylase